jgi:hypothetical protein
MGPDPPEVRGSYPGYGKPTKLIKENRNPGF